MGAEIRSHLRNGKGGGIRKEVISASIMSGENLPALITVGLTGFPGPPGAPARPGSPLPPLLPGLPVSPGAPLAPAGPCNEASHISYCLTLPLLVESSQSYSQQHYGNFPTCRWSLNMQYIFSPLYFACMCLCPIVPLTMDIWHTMFRTFQAKVHR